MSSSDSEDERRSTAAAAGPSGGRGQRLDNNDLPILFWDEMPDNYEENPDYIALQAVLTEDTTPESRAANFKEQGNKKLEVANRTRKKMFYHEALDFYTRGIKENCSDTKLHAVLLGNRAQVHLTLENYKKAYEDARRSGEADPSNVKAFFRAAKAALKLRQWATCRAACDRGLQVDAGAQELAALRDESVRLEGEQAAAQLREQQERDARLAPVRALVRELGNRGYRVGRPQFHAGDKRTPWLDKMGVMHWPSLFFYPEVMGNDAIEDFSENDTFADHLDVMFGPDAPPLEWDEERAYTRDTAELYYLSNCCRELRGADLTDAMTGKWPERLPEDDAPRRYGPNAANWTLVDPRRTLREVLSLPDHVIPGIPVFFVVAAGTAFRERFLQGELNRFG